MLASAFAASALGATSADARSGAPDFPLLLRGKYDHAAMMEIVGKRGPHRQCFLSNATLNGPPGVVNLYEKMTNAWTAFEFAFERRPATQQLMVCGVLIAANVIFALNDAMWKKYRFGEVFKLRDLSGDIATANYAARPSSNLELAADPADLRSIYHDYSSAALRKRGAAFFVCHNAIAGTAKRFAAGSGSRHAEIIAEWSQNVLPGFFVIPAGAAMVQILLEHGWHLYPVTD